MIMGDKPEIIFIIENKLGGVASFNKNIINHTSLRSKAIIKVILVNQVNSPHPRYEDKFLADEIITFNYFSYENRYSILKRLHSLIGNNDGAIVCNDDIEMQALYLYGTKKTVYQIIHDFYNIKLAVTYGNITDVFMAHTQLFQQALLSSDPLSVNSFFLPHGVEIPNNIQIHSAPVTLKIIFVGRLVESKGVQHLFAINEVLLKRGIKIEWTIIGRGVLDSTIKKQWENNSQVTFCSPQSNKEVLSIMAEHQLFILPTTFEGSPVSILEALACGLVPIVSDLPGGIKEIITENIGRRITVDSIESFANAIEEMQNDRILLNELRNNCRQLAIDQFDINKTSDKYFELLLQFSSLKRTARNLQPIQIGARLDKKWIPSSVVSFLRNRLK